MDDDFNTPRAIAVLFDLARKANAMIAEGQGGLLGATQVRECFAELAGDVLGFHDFWKTSKDEAVAEMHRAIMASGVSVGKIDRAEIYIDLLIGLRNDARAAKNFSQADAIRDRLAEAGILLEDTPGGTTWRLK